MNVSSRATEVSTAAAIARAQALMQEISSEIAKDCRELMRAEQKSALEEAMKEADELCDKAGCEQLGGLVSGGLNIVGGGIIVASHVSKGPSPAPADKPATEDAKASPAAEPDTKSATPADAAPGKAVDGSGGAGLSISNEGIEAAGECLTKTADPAGRLGDAAAARHEAMSRRAGALSDAHDRNAADQRDAADAARRAGESCAAAYRAMMDSYHQGIMTILARR